MKIDHDINSHRNCLYKYYTKFDKGNRINFVKTFSLKTYKKYIYIYIYKYKIYIYKIFLGLGLLTRRQYKE